MIIFVLIASVIAFALTNVFAKKMWQTLLSFVFGLLFVLSLGLIVGNITNHFGMKEVTETKTTPIVSSADQSEVNMLLYKSLGDGTEKVYLYRTDDKQKEPKATGTKNETNKVEQTEGTAEKVSETTYWVYKNDQYKFWFNLADNNHEFERRVNTFKIPAEWIELSTDQASELAKRVEEQKSTMEADAQNFVKEGLMQAIAQNPAMTQEEQQQVSKDLATTYQKQALAKLVEEVKK
ncbi:MULTISPECIES: DUF4811 domain-containing protein [unclassified Enterococcus]|uniref:DUF4811 domain-containing protein n=1 Tax=unclassified Enterococcus TaxID=2608891 RepID=UPI001A9A87C3|nr:DUF4811 domain-containing protein [Enterococcus sp. DIV1271a]MBO1299333.1 DUF4811 domain-containing protein [Enterococcus sp. DIV1271a]